MGTGAWSSNRHLMPFSERISGSAELEKPQRPAGPVWDETGVRLIDGRTLPDSAATSHPFPLDLERRERIDNPQILRPYHISYRAIVPTTNLYSRSKTTSYDRS